MRDTGAGDTARGRTQRARRATARRRERAQVAATQIALTTPPIGPPPRVRPPTPRERVETKIVNKAVQRGLVSGHPFTNRQAQAALSRYGFQGATAIEHGLVAEGKRRQQKLSQQREIARLRKKGYKGAQVAAGAGRLTPGRKIGWFEKAQTGSLGLVGGGGDFARVANLLSSVPRDITAMGIGLGQLTGRTGYDIALDVRDLPLGTARGRVPFRRTGGLARDVGTGLVSDYRRRYGKGFQEEFAQHPLAYLLDLYMGAGAVGRVGSVAKGAAAAHRLGVSPLEAVRQGWRRSVDPTSPKLYEPLKTRTRTLPSGARDVPFNWSRHPLGRFFQTLYDDFSVRYPGTRGIGAGPRAMRRAVRLERKQERRQTAAGARASQAVTHPGGRLRVKKGPADWRAFWEAGLPEHWRGPANIGLQKVHDYLVGLRDSPRRLAELEPTANLVAARLRVERLTVQYEKAAGKKRAALEKQLVRAGEDLRGAEDVQAHVLRTGERPPESAPEKLPSGLGRGRYVGDVSRRGGALSVAKDELERLERSHTNRIGQDLDKLHKRRTQLALRIHKTREGTATRDALEQRLERLDDTIDKAERVHSGKDYLRHEQLSRRIKEVEAAMKHEPDEQYRQALEGAETLTADLEKVAREVMGDDYVDAVFPRRLELLGRHMGADAESESIASNIFVPHVEQKARLLGMPTGRVSRGRGRRMSGKQATSSLGFEQRNRGVLLESGRLDPSLEHLVARWGRAQSWRFAQGIKDILWDAGEEIPVGGAPHPDWIVIDRSARPNPRFWENADLADDGALVEGLNDFVQRFQKVGEDIPRDQLNYENMRQVPKDTVDRVLGEAGVEPPGRVGKTVGRVFDVANGIVRTSLLYANPGYYPANFLSNMIFLGMHQGVFALPNLYRAGKAFARDRELANEIMAEVGQGPTAALGTATNVFSKAGKRVVHTAAGIPDNWPRVAAWYGEARKAGYKTAEEQKRLLRSDAPADVAMRERIGAMATNAMVDFNRISPFERSTLGRVFFVWPWIRGSAAWPTHYMREFPERGAFAGQASAQEHERDIAPYKAGLPAYLSGLIPLNEAGTHVLNIGSTSPTMSFAQLFQTSVGLANSFVHNVEAPKYSTLGDMTNPLIDFIWNTAHGVNQYGEAMGGRSALAENALELQPLAQIAMQATGATPVSRIYTDRDARAVLERRLGRVIPYDVDLQAIIERQKRDQPGPASTPESELSDWIKDVTKTLGPPNEAIRRAARNKAQVEIATDAYKKDRYGTTRHKLTDRETASVLLGVDIQQNGAVWSPETISARREFIRTATPDEVRQLISDLRDHLGGGILRGVNEQMGQKKRDLKQKRYVETHGGS